MESNDSPEIPDREETSDIPGFPSGGKKREREIMEHFYHGVAKISFHPLCANAEKLMTWRSANLDFSQQAVQGSKLATSLSFLRREERPYFEDVRGFPGLCFSIILDVTNLL